MRLLLSQVFDAIGDFLNATIKHLWILVPLVMSPWLVSHTEIYILACFAAIGISLLEHYTRKLYQPEPAPAIVQPEEKDITDVVLNCGIYEPEGESRGISDEYKELLASMGK